MPRYHIEYRRDARLQVDKLTKRQQVMVLDAVERQLTWEPLVRTRNRKPLEDSELGGWELRIRDLRAYYDVFEEQRIVRVLAVGLKVRDQVLIDSKLVRP